MKIRAIKPGKAFIRIGEGWKFNFTVVDGLNRVQVVEPKETFMSASAAKQAMRELVRHERIRNGLKP